MQNINNEKLNEIIFILHSLGIPSHLDGYRYLKELLYEKSNCFENKKNLYRCLSIKYQLSEELIERSIRYAIKIGWGRGKYELMEELFGYSVDDKKGQPTNLTFIITIIEKISMNYNF